MKKIDKLILKNFKFFYGEELLNFESKNILLYGENGSGKSSIYWGLYTLLQSSLKKTEEEKTRLQDYFDKNDTNTLVNRYMEDDDKSVIAIKLNDESQYIVSLDATNTNLNDTAIYESYTVSDFINYKLLAKNFDFKHREHLDIFEFLIDNVLNDVFIEDKTITFGKWWEKISSFYTPKGHANKYNNIKELEDDRTLFFTVLKEYLASISEDMNRILKSNFKIDINVKLELEAYTIPINKYRKIYKLDGKDKQQTTYYANAQYVNLHIEYDEHIKEENDKYIDKPHTYLNEAKLTAIALSIRFAILRRKATANDILKILVLDDLLVSLDMSHRDIVLNMIVEDEYLQDYQIIMLTHDKAFFEKAKQVFDYKARTKWKYFELYVDIDEERKFEIPYVKEYQQDYGNIEIAKEHHKNYDYPACANYLRKEVEKLFDKCLKLDNLDEKIKLAKLKENAHVISDIRDELKKIPRILEQFQHCKKIPIAIQPQKCKEFSEQVIASIQTITDYIENKLHYEEFEDVKLILKNILHPQSHNDIIKPLYKKELEDAIELMEAFNKIILESDKISRGD